jgi:hypothetical protein
VRTGIYVKIDTINYENLKAYCKVNGIRMDFVINKLIESKFKGNKNAKI